MKIITISREFGSGGREVGKRLADVLKFRYYDGEIIEAIAKESNMDEEYVSRMLESGSLWEFPITYGNSIAVFSESSVEYDAPVVHRAQGNIGYCQEGRGLHNRRP